VISSRSADRAASFPWTVPLLSTDLARVNIVLTGAVGVEGDFVGVERMRLDGVKSETVRLPETGVNGRPVVFDIVDFLGVVGGGIFSIFSTFSRLDILEGRETSASTH